MTSPNGTRPEAAAATRGLADVLLRGPLRLVPDSFEGFCLVSRSARAGMNVEVDVEPTAGERAT